MGTRSQDLEELSAKLGAAADLLLGQKDLPQIDCNFPDPAKSNPGDDPLGVGQWNEQQIADKPALNYKGYFEDWGDLPAEGGRKGEILPPIEGEFPQPKGTKGDTYVVGPAVDDYNPRKASVEDGATAPVYKKGLIFDKELKDEELKEYGVVTAEQITEDGKDSLRYYVKEPSTTIGSVIIPSSFLSTEAGECEKQYQTLSKFFKDGEIREILAVFINSPALLKEARDTFCGDGPNANPDICVLLSAVYDYCEYDTPDPNKECVTGTELKTIAKLLQGASTVLEDLGKTLANLDSALGGIENEEVQKELKTVTKALEIFRDDFGSFRLLADLSGTVGGVLDKLGSVLNGLNVGLIDLQKTLTGGGEKLSAEKVSLPTTSQVVADLVEKALSTPNGQLLVGGLEQTKGGIGEITSQLGAYVASLVATLSAALSEVKAKGPTVKAKLQDTVQTLNADVNAAKGAVGGMLMAAHNSPLPYGGNPQDAPEGTQLAGAYEYRVDAADHEAPATDVRFILGILALFGAGGVGVWLSRRGAA